MKKTPLKRTTPLKKKIRISKVDARFSLFIRTRDNWTCKRCGKKYAPPTNALQCSHFWGRGNKCTRFDPENCDSLCYGCHALWEGNKQGDYRDFKLKQLGKKGYESLERRARGICKEKDECLKALGWLSALSTNE